MYINACGWNLEKQYRQSYLQNRIGETDVKKKYLDTKWGKQGGMNWEIEINIYTLLMLGIKLIECRIPRIARRDKKAFLSDQCKEIEENKRMGKTRDLSRQLEIPREHFRQRWAQ